MKENEVFVSVIVTIRNDFPDVSHPFGVVGVVLEAKNWGNSSLHEM